MSTQASTYWDDNKKRGALEEQIDPSFSREALHPINQLTPQEAQLAQTAHQQQTLDDNFDVAAAAVAVSNDNQTSEPAQQEVKVPNEPEEINRVPRRNRPLTNTKRAEQNRVAQRNFRQRKEQHIRELEEKAKECEGLQQTIEALKQENMQLRDYSLALQAKLIEQPDVPPPPAVFATRAPRKS